MTLRQQGIVTVSFLYIQRRDLLQSAVSISLLYSYILKNNHSSAWPQPSYFEQYALIFKLSKIWNNGCWPKCWYPAGRVLLQYHSYTCKEERIDNLQSLLVFVVPIFKITTTWVPVHNNHILTDMHWFWTKVTGGIMVADL